MLPFQNALDITQRHKLNSAKNTKTAVQSLYCRFGISIVFNFSTHERQQGTMFIWNLLI